MISFVNAGKAYRSRKGVVNWVFRDFNASFAVGKHTGILAARGQGKTTLIATAAAADALSEGRIYRQGRISWPFGARSTIAGRLSGRQNLRFLTDVYGLDFGQAYDFVAQISELGRHLDLPLRQYTGEMRSRLAISLVLAMGFDHILIDDTIDGGDYPFRARCAKYLEDNMDRHTLFIATSNPLLLTRYCQAGGILNNGVITLYDTVDETIAEFNRITKAAA